LTTDAITAPSKSKKKREQNADTDVALFTVLLRANLERGDNTMNLCARYGARTSTAKCVITFANMAKALPANFLYWSLSFLEWLCNIVPKSGNWNLCATYLPDSKNVVCPRCPNICSICFR
jgi:hypothetical protein